MAINVTVDRGLQIIELDNPPVNALGAEVRQGIASALDAAQNDPSLRAVVFMSNSQKAFSGGADIKEFGKPPEGPRLPDLLNRITAFSKPFIAIVDGFALGGGCELALACNHRLAGGKASFALPEVKLGLIPGAGGTQRLPRVVGIEKAIDIIVGGNTVGAAEAASLGLVKLLREGGDWFAAVDALLSDVGDAAPQIDDKLLADADAHEALSVALDAAEKKGRLAHINALHAIKASAELSLEDGLVRERELFVECLESDQRKAMIHGFFAEREAGKIAELDGVEPIAVKEIAVLGAGTMGRGIAIAAIDAGYHVSLFDIDEGARNTAGDAIKAHYDRQRSKGRMDGQRVKKSLSAINIIGDFEALSSADLFIEAVIEDMAIKKRVFADLDRIAKPDAILASNTSYLDINEIATATARPGSVLGMHFFSPANIMKLLEIIKADKTDAKALATAFAVGRKLKKVSVLAGVCDGFIGNRIFKKYRQEAEYIIEDGALPQDVDRVMRDFGFAMGPFQVADLAGLDIGWYTRRREDATRPADKRYVHIADRLYELGRLGQKTGAGWYQYDGRKGSPDPVVEAIIIEESAKKNIARKQIGDAEILQRLLGCMIEEGRAILDEKIALRASDIDVVLVKGYGFPDVRGGPMFYADQHNS